MNSFQPYAAGNCQPVKLSDIPLCEMPVLREFTVRRVRDGARIAGLCVVTAAGQRRLLVVLADHKKSLIYLAWAAVANSYPAFTPVCAQANLFEREIFEQFDIVPEGHPWLKPVRFSRADKKPVIGDTAFFSMSGEQVHEVAVGPVHAGIIEPGHFRFQCTGEKVWHLEISLGYQHRGVEAAIINGPDKKTLHYLETLCGDTTVGHALAYCHAIEALSGAQVSLRAQVIRGIALELERLANHTGDLGALANDVAYLPTASYCGRLRGDFLNMTALICGNRFGRGLVKPGGVAGDLDAQTAGQLRQRLVKTFNDTKGAADLLFNTPSVLDRFEDTGIIAASVCQELGLVGPPARACGLEQDSRRDFPYGVYSLVKMPVSAHTTGDVYARALLRWLEIKRSTDFIQGRLAGLREGEISVCLGEAAKDSLVVSLVEGWRGPICHIIVTNNIGKISNYKVIDPSFYNWLGLSLATRGQQISDFPLCNKSFNLSYCGHDL